MTIFIKNYAFKLRAVISALLSIALVVIAGCGGSSSDKTSFTPSRKAPDLSITAPTGNGPYTDSETINFSAVATDSAGTDISNDIKWYSDILGEIGEGANISITLEAATHRISSEVTDSNNESTRKSIDIEVTPSNGNVTVSWVIPTENTDGSELTDLAGFKIYYGEERENLDQEIVLNNPAQTSQIIEDLSVGKVYYFTVICFNQYYIESELSEIVSKQI